MCLAVFTFDEITHNKLARLIDMSCDQRKTLVVTPMYTRGLVCVVLVEPLVAVVSASKTGSKRQ